MYTARERFQAVMIRGDVSKGFPIIEWASWWNLTRENWIAQGVPADADLQEYFGLDRMRQLWLRPTSKQTPAPKDHGGPIIQDEDDYERILPTLYRLPQLNADAMRQWRTEQEQGQAILWLTLEGPFWYPRRLFGIQGHLYAFYDYPELMKRINADLAEYNLAVLTEVCKYFIPDFITIAEDMSYNHGSMISYAQMDEFMAPFYWQVIPEILKYGIIPLIDSDGQVEPLIPWFEDVGIQGILPLERMAGVDVNRIRAAHPQWRMIGGFDKTVMNLGEDALRAEFDRIKPAVMGGYFIPSCDHQTPPEVSVEDYRLYVRLLREFSDECAREARRGNSEAVASESSDRAI